MVRTAGRKNAVTPCNERIDPPAAGGRGISLVAVGQPRLNLTFALSKEWTIL